MDKDEQKLSFGKMIAGAANVVRTAPKWVTLPVINTLLPAEDVRQEQRNENKANQSLGVLTVLSNLFT